MNKTCGTCKHWEKSAFYSPDKFRACSQIKVQFHEAHEPQDETAFIWADSKYRDVFFTATDFGCTEWESLFPDETEEQQKANLEQHTLYTS